MKDIVIYGDSSFSERMAFFVTFEQQGNIVAYTNKRDFITRESINGVPVIPYDELDSRIDKSNVEVLIAIGYTKMNYYREEIYKDLKKKGYKVATFISMNSILYTNSIGEGTIILPDVYVGPNVKHGVCKYLAASVKISHDSIIGDYNFLSTNVVMGGYANIENSCFIGLNATIRHDITLASKTFIGSGGNLLCSTEENCIYVGNPAKKLDKKSTDVKI